MVSGCVERNQSARNRDKRDGQNDQGDAFFFPEIEAVKLRFFFLAEFCAALGCLGVAALLVAAVGDSRVLKR